MIFFELAFYLIPYAMEEKANFSKQKSRLISNYMYKQYKQPLMYQNPATYIIEEEDTANPFLFQAHHQKNPLIRSLNSVFHNLIPIIASLTLPEIQPLLDIITKGFDTIYEGITIIFRNSLTQIQEIINKYISEYSKKIEQITTEGNNKITISIIKEFRNINKNFLNEVIKITQQESIESSDLISSASKTLIEYISNRMIEAQDLIDDAVKEGLKIVVSEVLKAIKYSNDNVFTQIKELIADHENTEAILPQLIFADPTAISQLLKSEKNAIYANVRIVLLDALTDIEQYTDLISAETISEETYILNIYNDAIVKVLNILVKDALVAIEKSISNTTQSQLVEVLKTLLQFENEKLIEEIENAFSKITPLVRSLIYRESGNMISKISQITTASSANVVIQVNRILSSL